MRIHFRRAAAVLFVVASCASTLAHAAAVSGQGDWETTLQARYFDNNATVDGYYDTTLGITWLANANYAGTTMNWSTANTWAAGLNFNGITGWRLPTTIDVGNNGCSYTNPYQGVDCRYNITTHSEMSHMFYVTLGNKAYYSTTGTAAQPGWGLTNTANFTGVQAYDYWSGTEYAPDTALAWGFGFGLGGQFDRVKSVGIYAWAVHSGDVGATSPVPVPAAVWLFGSGLVGLIGFARRRKK